MRGSQPEGASHARACLFSSSSPSPPPPFSLTIPAAMVADALLRGKAYSALYCLGAAHVVGGFGAGGGEGGGRGGAPLRGKACSS